MMGEVGLMPLCRDHELARHDAGALMNQLVKRVLAVGAGFAPDDGAGIDLKIVAFHRHTLAVRFHLQLLQIGGQPRQALIIGQHGAGGIAADLIVPDTHQRQQHGQVVGQVGLAEMRVHGVATGQEIVEILRSHRQHDAKPDRPPERIAPADPIGEAENAVRVDAELRGQVRRGGEGRELRTRFVHLLGHPVARGLRVGHGLDGGEGLGGNDDQRAGGIEPLQRVMDMRAVDIRDVMDARPVMVRGQRQRRHGRAKVRTADADIDHIGVTAALPFNVAFAHRAGEPGHALAGRQHLLHHVLPIDMDRTLGGAQRGMQHGAALGLVDLGPGEHGLSTRLDFGIAGQFQQQRERIGADMCLGVIEEHIAETGAEIGEALFVFEHLGKAAPGLGGVLRFQVIP